jgi:peptide/nickel transport system permease protein
MPGDPFTYSSSVSGEDNTTNLSREQMEYMRSYYGMDKPFFDQFTDTVGRNLSGDFGLSIHYKRAASDILAERLPWTLFIMASTLLLSLLIGSFLALWCIRSKAADKIIFSIASVISEIPPYLIAILLLFLIAANVRWLPLSGAVTAFGEYATHWEWIKDVLLHALLPITALCLVSIPRFYFTARASFLSIVEKPYILNAKAKGLREHRIRWRYIFFNGITPVIARFFLSVGTTVGGTLLIENVFAYPGLGTVMREAVKYRDYIMIQDVFLLSATIVLISMFVADLINGLVDKESADI